VMKGPTLPELVPAGNTHTHPYHMICVS
jgi:hypothetical protein